MKKLLVGLWVIFICTFAIAETININWKVDGTNYAQSSCQTGSNLTLPANNPTKYGYDFVGWSVNTILTGTVKTGNNNLFDVAKSKIATECTLQQDGSYETNNISTMSMWVSYNKIVFNGEENTQYTISLKLKAGTATDITVGWVYSDGTTSIGNPRGTFANFTTVTAVSAQNKTVVGFGFAYGVSGTAYIKDIQIEKGITATAYEPYNGWGLPSPTHPVEPEFYTVGNITLRALGTGDNKIADTYDTTTGKITRRVGVKVLDGTENWTSDYSYMSILKSSLRTNIAQNSTNLLCTHYPIGTPNSINTVYVGNANLNFTVISTYPTIADWTAHLAYLYEIGTPVTIYYPLSTPIEENVN